MVKPGEMLPPALAKSMREQMKAAMPGPAMTSQLKGNRAFSQIRGISSISDFDGAMITLVDQREKKYATAERSVYMRKLADSQGRGNAPTPDETHGGMAGIKMSSEFRKTGQTRTIRGIRATETEMTITMEMPGTPSDSMRAVVAVWLAEKQEVERNPALRELAFFSRRAFAGTDPAGEMGKAFDQSPGLRAAFEQLVAEIKDVGVMLEIQVTTYMPPSVTAIFQQAASNNPDSTKVDPSGPFMTTVMTMTELSTAEVPDSVFEIPRDYTAVDIGELLGVMMRPAGPPAPTTQP
jgi:hypothetical protein